MRYMMLIYSKEQPEMDRETAGRIYAGHIAVMEEAGRKGVLIGAEPLAPTSTATTVRVKGGKTLTTDGPFAETKEQLAGYYIIECQGLAEAVEWASKIPTGCKGAEGCVEIRSLPGIPAPPEADAGGAAVTFRS